jgi:hypothetical protein
VIGKTQQYGQFLITIHHSPFTVHQSLKLFQQVGQVWHQCEVAGTLDSGGHSALVLQAVAGDAAWKHFALFVDELKQKVSVFVVNVLDAELAEAAVLLALLTDIWIAEKLDIVP